MNLEIFNEWVETQIIYILEQSTIYVLRLYMKNAINVNILVLKGQLKYCPMSEIPLNN